jgi:uncharacterized glyoxalase superfamily protein PhnB
MHQDVSTPNTPTGDAQPMAPLGVVLQVRDINAASRFYQTLGFTESARFPRADGELMLAILTYGPSTLLVGRRDELHYENEARARRIRRGPHGLGVVITLLVPDLAAVYDVVKAAGHEILLDPVDEFYGDRVFMFLDADGFEWKVSETVAEVGRDDVAAVIAES